MDGEKIFDRIRIASILEHLIDQSAPLSVALPGQRLPVNSTLLRILENQGQLVLDNFTPALPDDIATASRWAAIHARTGGIDIAFGVRLAQRTVLDGFPCWTTSFPVELHYLQRRAHFRAHANLGRPIGLTLRRHDGSTLPGWLMDISSGGLGALIATDPRHRPEPGEWVRVEGLTHPACGVVEARAEIRHIHPESHDSKPTDGATTKLVAGIRFMDVDARMEEVISRMVANLDRERARTQIR